MSEKLLTEVLQTRGILLDLIAELRDIYEDMGGGWELKEAADRAEARLRGNEGVCSGDE